jgi:hypothetical protein
MPNKKMSIPAILSHLSAQIHRLAFSTNGKWSKIQKKILMYMTKNKTHIPKIIKIGLFSVYEFCYCTKLFY